MEHRSIALAFGLTMLASSGCSRDAPGPRYASRPVWAADAVVTTGTSDCRHGSCSTGYLRSHSLDDGTLLASVVLRHEYDNARDQFEGLTCEVAVGDRLWCLENGDFHDVAERGLRVRDARSLQTVALQSQLLGSVPALSGTPIDQVRLYASTRGFVFETRDGYGWIVDPTSMAPARFSGSLRSIASLTDRRFHTSPEISGYSYSFDSETRVTLHRHDSAMQSGDVPLHPEHTYLRGRFLTNRYEPIVLDDPPRLLVFEDVVDRGPTLWCLLADGTVQWKVSDLPERSRFVDAKVHRDKVVLVFTDTLLALRTQNGTMAWRAAP